MAQKNQAKRQARKPHQLSQKGSQKGGGGALARLKKIDSEESFDSVQKDDKQFEFAE